MGGRRMPIRGPAPLSSVALLRLRGAAPSGGLVHESSRSRLWRGIAHSDHGVDQAPSTSMAASALAASSPDRRCSLRRAIFPGFVCGFARLRACSRQVDSAHWSCTRISGAARTSATARLPRRLPLPLPLMTNQTHLRWTTFRSNASEIPCCSSRCALRSVTEADR